MGVLLESFTIGRSMRAGSWLPLVWGVGWCFSLDFGGILRQL